MVGIGQGRIVHDIMVELHSLEVRELGSFLLLRTDAPGDDRHWDVSGADFTVTDDRGTKYSALLVAGDVATAGAGARSRERGRVMIVPGIPRVVPPE